MKLKPGARIEIKSTDGRVWIKIYNPGVSESTILASDFRHPEMGIDLRIEIIDKNELTFDLGEL